MCVCVCVSNSVCGVCACGVCVLARALVIVRWGKEKSGSLPCNTSGTVLLWGIVGSYAHLFVSLGLGKECPVCSVRLESGSKSSD